MYICPQCGGELEETYSGILECPSCHWGCEKDDYESDCNDYYDDGPDEDDMPECCKACGGPYPSCMTSCKIFDD